VSNEILVFGLDDDAQGGDRVFGMKSSVVTYARDAVSTDQLKSHLEAFVRSMKDVLTAVPKAMGNYQINEVSFTVQVSAKGTVSLLGMGGGEVGGTGGITIKLKHKDGQNEGGEGENSESD
jgi:hypothetical protein